MDMMNTTWRMRKLHPHVSVTCLYRIFLQNQWSQSTTQNENQEVPNIELSGHHHHIDLLPAELISFKISLQNSTKPSLRLEV